MQNSTPPTSSRHPAQKPMYRIIQIDKRSGKKYYWHGFSKEYPGHWSSSTPINAYWEKHHAQAVMTRKGWKNSDFSWYTYEIEEC